MAVRWGRPTSLVATHPVQLLMEQRACGRVSDAERTGPAGGASYTRRRNAALCIKQRLRLLSPLTPPRPPGTPVLTPPGEAHTRRRGGAPTNPSASPPPAAG